MRTYRFLTLKVSLPGLVFLIAASASSYAAVTTEKNTDRPGSDYAGYDLPSADPQLCAKACADDAKCKAYTFVKPGLQGPAARCYLKDPAPAALPNDCCVSGVRTRATTLRARSPSELQTRTQRTLVPTAISPEARAEGAAPKREFPAEFLYAYDDSVDLEAYFKGRFRDYGLVFDWNESGSKRVRFRWLKKSDRIASARWEISTAPFAPVKAGGVRVKPNSAAKSLQSAPSATPALTHTQSQMARANPPAQTLLGSGPAPLAQLATRPDRAPAPLWSEFEIDLGSYAPFVLQGLVVDPVKTDKTIGGPNPNDLRPNLYVRVVLFGADKKPLGAQSNMITIQFRKITLGALRKPTFFPSVAGVEATVPWRAYAWNYQCYAVYSRDYVIPFVEGAPLFSAKRGDKVDLCKKHDSAWYEDIGNAFIDVFSSLFEFVEDTVNWVATKYNEVKAEALGAVISTLKGVTGCGNICQAAVGAAFDAGLAAAGMPPSLPDFDELVANLEGDGIGALAQTMTDAAAAQGIPTIGLKDQIQTGLTKLKDELKLELSKKKVGGAAPLAADLSKQYRPMTVVFRMRNNGAAKSEDTSVCIRQSTQTPDAQRSMGYFPACAAVPALMPGATILVSIDVEAFDDPKAWESFMPTENDYANVFVNAGVIVSKTNAAKTARDAWANKYVHSNHNFDVSIGKDRVAGLNCGSGGCVRTQ